MLPAPPSAPVAALEALVVAAMALGLGYLIVDVVIGRRRVDRTVRWGLAFAALYAYALVVMVLHIATGGGVLSRPWLVRIGTLVVALGLAIVAYRRRSAAVSEDPHEARALLTAVALGLLLWGIAVALLLPLDYKGDTGLHMAWANGLMAGESTPSGPITGDIPNFYPWLFHALVALLAWFTPGHNAYHALSVVQLLQVTAMVLALFALGKQLTSKWQTGFAASLFGALTGGVGFFLLRRLDLVMNPRADDGAAGMRYLGDLVFNRTYNFAFNNLGPPFPRDVAFSLVPVFLLLVVIALSSNPFRARMATLVAAGGVVGMMWLTHVDSLVIVGGTLGLLVVFPNRKGMLVAALTVLGVAALIWSLWTVPLFINYLRYGFRSTILGPIVLPPLGVLGAWGVVTPFAVYGAVKWVPKAFSHPGARLLLAWAISTAAMIFVAPQVPRIFGSGFGTLGYQHRYWPFFALGGALYASLGATELLERVHGWSARTRAAVVGGVLVLALPSPFLGSLGLYQKQAIDSPGRTLLPSELGLPASVRGHETTLTRLAPNPGMRCTVAVPPEIGGGTLAYSGYRHVMYVRTFRAYERYLRGDIEGGQLAHVRWRRIFRHIPPEAERIEANRTLTEGATSPEAWRRTADDWGVNVVVVEAGRRNAPAFSAYEDAWTEQEGSSHIVIWLDDSCA